MPDLTLAGTSDALIVGVSRKGDKALAMFTVDRPAIPDMVQDFIKFHRTMKDAHPADTPDDPGTLAWRVLFTTLGEPEKACTDAVCHAAIYFLATFGKPHELIGPTMVRVDDQGVGSRPLDVAQILKDAGMKLH